ncbi:serine hydrolase domain-containing protein [Methylobacterium sp. D54C]
MTTQTAQDIVANNVASYLEQNPGTPGQGVAVVAGVIDASDCPYDPSSAILICQQAQAACWRTGAPVTLDGSTPFNIGSITKLYSTMAMAWLVNPTSWGTVGDYLTGFPAAVASIPLYDLASYQSGFLADNLNNWLPGWPGPVTKEDLVNTLNTMVDNNTFNYKPSGTCYSYSNLAVGLLGLCAVAQHGSSSMPPIPAQQKLISDLLDAVGIIHANTAPFPAVSNGIADMPRGYRNGKPMASNAAYLPDQDALGGAGNLNSCGNDLYNFLALNMGLAGNSTATSLLQAMQNVAVTKNGYCFPPPSGAAPKVGLGWFYASVSDTDTSYLWKDGAVPGFTSFIALDRSIDPGVKPASTGIFVLTNSDFNYSGSSGAYGLGSAIMSELLGNSDIAIRPDRPNMYLT